MVLEFSGFEVVVHQWVLLVLQFVLRPQIYRSDSWVQLVYQCSTFDKGCFT